MLVARLLPHLCRLTGIGATPHTGAAGRPGPEMVAARVKCRDRVFDCPRFRVRFSSSFIFIDNVLHAFTCLTSRAQGWKNPGFTTTPVLVLIIGCLLAEIFLEGKAHRCACVARGSLHLDQLQVPHIRHSVRSDPCWSYMCSAPGRGAMPGRRRLQIGLATARCVSARH